MSRAKRRKRTEEERKAYIEAMVAGGVSEGCRLAASTSTRPLAAPESGSDFPTSRSQYYVLEQASAALPITEGGIRNRLYACDAAVLRAGQLGGTQALASFIILPLSSNKWSPVFLFFLWEDLAVFGCRTHGDLQRLPVQPMRLKDFRGAAAYVNFVRLPDKRPHRIAAPGE